jgi:hypothetical protein
LMEQKQAYDIHTDPRNAIVTGDAVLVIGPGRVSFHGKVGDLDPQAIADAWALAGALRNSGEAQAVPDVPAATDLLGELRWRLIALGDVHGLHRTDGEPCDCDVCTIALPLIERAVAALTGSGEDE